MKRCMGCMERIDETLSICPKCGFDDNITEEKKDILRIGTKLCDRYTIGKSLGRGGFGITYIAWDEKLQRKVAIKEYMPRGLAVREPGTSIVKSDTEQSFSFEKGIKKTIEESRKLAGLSHLDSVVTVFDCIKENGTAYIVMELLNGQNVKQYIQTKGKLSFDETIKIITPVLKTLSAVHKAGLIHRDISPDNIFICKNGKVKLLDFGSARIAEGGDETSRSIILKHGYAPKEQYSSRGRQGAYTDMYAVAATIYKMLTGITPEDCLERITGVDELKNISELVEIPRQAALAIMKCLEIKGKDRIQTADEFLQKLTEVEKPIYQGEETVTMLSEDVKKKYGDALAKAEAAEVTVKQEISAEETELLIKSENTIQEKSQKINEKVSVEDDENVSTEKDAIYEKEIAKRKKIAVIICIIVLIAVVAIALVIYIITVPTQEIAETETTTQESISQEDCYNQAVEYENNGERFKAICSYFDAIGYKDSVKRLRKLLAYCSISADSCYTIGLKSDGTVVTTGDNDNGQFGVDKWTDIVAISSGVCHTVGLKSDGTVVATKYSGDEDYNFGQCDVYKWTDIVAVSDGGYHTVGLKSDGTVVDAGNNESYQCDVEDWTDIVAVSAGYDHTVGLKSDGTVVAVGYNYLGQCDVDKWTDIITVSAGYDHTVGLKSDGTVVAVGDNTSGQCDVEDWTDIVAVSAGSNQTIGLKSDGTVVAVGNNDCGQCDIDKWNDIVAIYAVGDHTVGLKSDGTVVAVGYNYDGQCDVDDWKNIRLPYKSSDEIISTTEEKTSKSNNVTLVNDVEVCMYAKSKIGRVENTGEFGLILRETPEKLDDNSNKIGLIDNGTEVEILGYSKENPKYFYIDVNGEQGFAACKSDDNVEYIIIP